MPYIRKSAVPYAGIFDAQGKRLGYIRTGEVRSEALVSPLCWPSVAGPDSGCPLLRVLNMRGVPDWSLQQDSELFHAEPDVATIVRPVIAEELGPAGCEGGHRLIVTHDAATCRLDYKLVHVGAAGSGEVVL